MFCENAWVYPICVCWLYGFFIDGEYKAPALFKPAGIAVLIAGGALAFVYQ